jgi:hypothetical protein
MDTAVIGLGNTHLFYTSWIIEMYFFLTFLSVQQESYMWNGSAMWGCFRWSGCLEGQRNGELMLKLQFHNCSLFYVWFLSVLMKWQKSNLKFPYICICGYFLNPKFCILISKLLYAWLVCWRHVDVAMYHWVSTVTGVGGHVVELVA